MEKNERKMKIILIAIIIIVLIVATVWLALLLTNKNNKMIQTTKTENQIQNETIEQKELTKKEDDGTIVNVSQKLNENKEIDGFIITNINFTEKDGNSEMLACITNKTGYAQEGFLVDVVLYSQQGNEIGRIPASVLPTEANETIQIRAKITENYINAYDFKLEKKQ